jgi:hypothetical protein
LAVNKAERNAFRKLIPEKLIAAMVKEFLARRKARTVSVATTPAAREEAKTEGTTAAREVPIPPNPSPSQPAEIERIGQWKVPLANDQVPEGQKPEGLTQIPLDHDLRQWGMLNQLQDEISIVPREPLPYDPEKGPIHWFLEGSPDRSGIVRPICEKWNSDPNHKKLRYDVVTEGGFLKAIILTGDVLDYPHVRDLLNAAWAFHILLEPDWKAERKTPLDRSQVGGPLR